MSTVGQIKQRTQGRVLALFQRRLGYSYLGNSVDLDNRDINPALLDDWLAKATALLLRQSCGTHGIN